MSFGTGHHETTFLVCKELFDINLENKNVLDFGCGTEYYQSYLQN